MMSFGLGLGLMLPVSTSGQTVYINELLAINDAVISDEAGEFDDWIEFYNPGATSIDLGGYYLTDDLSNPTAWEIPTDNPTATTIPAGGYLLFWTDGQPDQGTLHGPFKLSGAGEQVGLFMPDGITPIDTVTFPSQIKDISYGRQPDGGDAFLNFAEATPGGSNNTAGSAFAVAPIFTPPGGFYTGGAMVTLHTPSSNADIYYTIDGSVPTENSPHYNGPISTDTTIALRAITLASGLLPSRISTHTYLINEAFTLPTLSLVSDPINLYDEEMGILVDGPPRPGCTERCENYWQDWERDAHAEYFEADGTPAFSLDLGVKVSGFFSRVDAKKSLALRTRSRYGTPNIRYPIFSQKPDEDRYDGLQVRASSFERTKNEAFYELNELSGRRMDMQAYQPAIIFLNGQYHGIYNVMERKNADLVKSNYGYNDIDLFDAVEGVLEGDREQMNETTNYLSSSDFRQSGGYAFADANLVDMESLIEHYATTIIMGRTDFGNVRMWRPRETGGRWRMMTFDYDVSLLDHDTVDWMLTTSTDRWLHGMLPFLLENNEFRERFITRISDLLNSTFSPATHRAMIDQVASRVQPEMTREIERWQIQYNTFMQSFGAWLGFVNERKTFARLRPDRVRNHLKTHLNLGDPLRISITPFGQGTVRVNSIEGIDRNWLGFYFPGIPVTLTAEPAPGFAFAGWSEPSLGNDPTVAVTLTADLNLAPQFTQSVQPPDVAFNEINFNAAGFFDTRDWVELYNPTDETVDLSGWIFEDGTLNEFIVPDGTTIEAQGYQVLCRDREAFFQTYGETIDCVGDFGFGLSELGETLTLRHPTRILVDAITYSAEAPWPTDANGSGATIALNEPDEDNALPENWRASLAVGGTPGAANHTETEPPSLVINEINYNSSDAFDARDWVELYNPVMEFVEVSGLIFRDTDSDTLFTIPDGMLMFPNSYLVLCRDQAAFQAVYPNGPECVGDLGFGLANAGEKILIWNQDRVVVDSLTFDEEAPWPVEANGEGFTLELTSPGRDNALVENWAASLNVGGTPGSENTVFVSAETEGIPVDGMMLEASYPNPFRETTQIGYHLDRPAKVQLRIFNAAGRQIKDVHLGQRLAGVHTFAWTVKDLSAGVYFYQLLVDGEVLQTRAAMLVR